MQITDATGQNDGARHLGPGVRLVPLYPTAHADSALLAVDLLEIEPGSETPQLQGSAEQVLFVLSGRGQVTGAGGSPSALLGPGSVVYLSQGEAHTVRATGSEPLRVLSSASLLVRAARVEAQAAAAPRPDRVRESRPADPATAEVAPTPEPEASEAPAPTMADISAIMKRGSDVGAAPRPERRRTEPAPETEPAAGELAEETEEPEHHELLELSVAFDGGSRGNPGQGYGSYLVQSPGRKPVVKRVEFGDNYTNNQAEYDSLIAALEYIIDRLNATGRTPEQVALDIKSDSDLVVNQLQGTYKVKEGGLKPRHARALELLDQFGAWMIAWHPREESVRLLGH
ncbi:MAG TPA: cupin domain-containing protein [Chloroflexia bacterium]|nr:cupin domain-containing protein [Chloroflexia bacterium]